MISWLTLAIGATRLLDALTTYIGFRIGFAEGNPYAVSVIGRIGFLGLVGLEAVIFFFCVWLARWVSRLTMQRSWFVVILGVYALVFFEYVLPVLNNALLILFKAYG